MSTDKPRSTYILQKVFYAIFKRKSKTFNIGADHVLTTAVHVPVILQHQ